MEKLFKKKTINDIQKEKFKRLPNLKAFQLITSVYMVFILYRSKIEYYVRIKKIVFRKNHEFGNYCLTNKKSARTISAGTIFRLLIPLMALSDIYLLLSLPSSSYLACVLFISMPPHLILMFPMFRCSRYRGPAPLPTVSSISPLHSIYWIPCTDRALPFYPTYNYIFMFALLVYLPWTTSTRRLPSFPPNSHSLLIP